jgi:hypothetical protein
MGVPCLVGQAEIFWFKNLKNGPPNSFSPCRRRRKKVNSGYYVLPTMPNGRAQTSLEPKYFFIQHISISTALTALASIINGIYK